MDWSPFPPTCARSEARGLAADTASYAGLCERRQYKAEAEHSGNGIGAGSAGSVGPSDTVAIDVSSSQAISVSIDTYGLVDQQGAKHLLRSGHRRYA